MPHLDFQAREGNSFSRNETFLEKLRDIVQSNLSNEQFGVNMLAEKMDISRIQLYRKLQKLTGKNISQYIREFRLERAMKLLREGIASVTETAYQVGFGSPSYFNKCFHEYYGYTPGEVAKLNEQKEKEVMISPTAVNKPIYLKSLFKKYRKINFSRLAGSAILITAVIIIILGISAFLFNRFLVDVPPPLNKEKTIAVLPFHNDSQDPDNEYICNGILEEILTHLQKIESLNVKSRTSVERYRGTDQDIKSIGKELGVNYLLEGSVCKAGDELRVIVALIDVKKGYRLWTETYDGIYNTEIFRFQGDIAKKIASSLQIILTPAEEEFIDRLPTRHMAAYDYLLRGWEMIREYWNSLDSKYIQIAQNLLNRALEIDTGFIEAYELKCEIYWLEKKPDSIIYYADKIIELDPGRFDGYRTAGNAYQRIGKFDLAIESFKKALDLEPDDIRTNRALGRLYLSQKLDLKNGLFYLQRALELEDNPSPDLIRYVGAAISEIGYYEKAEEYISKAIQMGDGCQGIQRKCECLFAQGKIAQSLQFLDSIYGISACQKPCTYYKFYLNISLGEYGLAEQYYKQILDYGAFGDNIWSFFPIDSISIAFMYKKLGKKDTASDILMKYRKSNEKQLKESPWDLYRINLKLAFIHAIQGEKEKALHYLTETLKYGPPFWTDLTPINFYFENFLDEPEFKAFIKKGTDLKVDLQEQYKKMEGKGLIDLLAGSRNLEAGS